MIRAIYKDQRFTAVEARPVACHGCMFLLERAEICRQACIAAQYAGLPDCEDKAPSGKTYIYVPDTSDERQVELLPQGATA